jgi:hypothetical protein
MEKETRYRVNVTISTKGQKTWDCTCESQGMSMDEILIESDKLVAELQKRYPVQVTEK